LLQKIKVGEKSAPVTPKERPFRPGSGKKKFSGQGKKKSHGAKVGAKPVWQ
jgi:hypothetical protein